METIAFRMMLNPGMREEYERRHAQIWPELVDALHNAGVREYRIFFDPDSNHLFAVLTRTSHHTMDQLAQLEVMRKWWDYMADIMPTAADHTPLQQSLEPVFHLNSLSRQFAT